MAKWKKVKLEEIANVQTGPFGSQLHNKDYVIQGTPIVTVEHLGNRSFTTQNLPLVSKEDSKRLSKYVLNTGDIVFSRVGSVDRCSYVSKDENGWLFSGRCLRVRSNKDIAPLFLYYFFCSENTKQKIRNIAVGATMPSINTALLQSLVLTVPELTEQKKIAEILSSLDDKIELNNRINGNLEQQAQAIFKEWFVDNAKPEWKKGKLEDLIDIQYGKDHKKLADGIVPVYGSGGIMRYAEKAIYSQESVLIPRKGTLNNVIYVNKPFWSVDTMFYTIMKKTNVAKFVYFFLKSINLAAMNAGSAVPSMTTEILNKLEVLIPDNNILKQYDLITTKLFDSITENTIENEKLCKIRDTLLPKLMNGEIEV